jgi:hypothetical protein
MTVLQIRGSGSLTAQMTRGDMKKGRCHRKIPCVQRPWRQCRQPDLNRHEVAPVRF